jgi:hypothetical protein
MASQSGMHAMPFKHSNKKLDTTTPPAEYKPSVKKTWLVVDPWGTKLCECGTLESAQTVARDEAKTLPDMVFTIFEAVEMFRAPLASTETVKL